MWFELFLLGVTQFAAFGMGWTFVFHAYDCIFAGIGAATSYNYHKKGCVSNT